MIINNHSRILAVGRILERRGFKAHPKTFDVSPIVKAIESGEISLADMNKIMRAIQAREGAQEPDGSEPAEAAVPDIAPQRVPGGESMKMKGAFLKAREERLAICDDAAVAEKALHARGGHRDAGEFADGLVHAKEFAAEWRTLRKTQRHLSMTQQQYVEIHLQRIREGAQL